MKRKMEEKMSEWKILSKGKTALLMIIVLSVFLQTGICPAYAKESTPEKKALYALSSRMAIDGKNLLIYKYYDAPVFLRSYDTENIAIKNVAFSYDNALVAMAFISAGEKNKAQKIVDAFVWSIEHDRTLTVERFLNRKTSKVRRVRNAYTAGYISVFPGTNENAKIPGWYDTKINMWLEDQYQVGSNVGNTSFVALALLQYYNKYGGKKYLDTAAAIMNWVIENCTDDNDGFTGGFDGWEEADDPSIVYKHTYKSIEHNIDAYAAFKALYAFTGEEKYNESAQSAKRFIEAMYDDTNKMFCIGTLEDGITPGRMATVLDAQVWCAMALGEDFELYRAVLDTVEKMKTPEGGYAYYYGKDKDDGFWSEGTAFTALMYRLRGENEKYEAIMKALADVQKDDGMLPAANIDHLNTGLYNFDGSPREYSTESHIAPTAWYIMAANGFNPFVMQESVPHPVNERLKVVFEWIRIKLFRTFS